MSLPLRRNPFFTADVQHQFAWYWDEAGESVAWRFEAAVEETLRLIARQPGLGRQRKLPQPQLRGLQSFRVTPPFDRLLIFYRVAGGEIEAWRVMHGARDLRRRLQQPPVEL